MSEPLLAVRSLNAYYGPAHILQGVTFEMGVEPVALIGRNGMGKSTLCNAIMGLVPDVKGSVRFNGEELVGRQPYKISNAGIGLVPQGRRLFPSLSTDEHLRMLGSSSGEWSRERVYELFPRLSERRNISATQLSGGEQQMLAIGRTLLRNPRLLIMDEPSEGLAPTLVVDLKDTLARLVADGVRMLIVEQNLSVATSVAGRLLVMLNGRIADETTPAALEADPGAKQRYLGVTPRADEQPTATAGSDNPEGAQ
jgi:branched-chain amino acid transport system ATP-binding protein